MAPLWPMKSGFLGWDLTQCVKEFFEGSSARTWCTTEIDHHCSEQIGYDQENSNGQIIERRGRKVSVSTRQDVMWIYIFTVFCQNPHYSYFCVCWLAFNKSMPVLEVKMSIQRACTQEGISNRQLETYSKGSMITSKWWWSWFVCFLRSTWLPANPFFDKGNLSNINILNVVYFQIYIYLKTFSMVVIYRNSQIKK